MSLETFCFSQQERFTAADACWEINTGRKEMRPTLSKARNQTAAVRLRLRLYICVLFSQQFGFSWLMTHLYLPAGFAPNVATYSQVGRREDLFPGPGPGRSLLIRFSETAVTFIYFLNWELWVQRRSNISENTQAKKLHLNWYTSEKVVNSDMVFIFPVEVVKSHSLKSTRPVWNVLVCCRRPLWAPPAASLVAVKPNLRH